MSSNKPTEDDTSDTESLDIPRFARSQGTEEAMDPLQRINYEARVQDARKGVKRGIAWDFVTGTLWVSWCVWQIGFGKRCTPGGYGGWWALFEFHLFGFERFLIRSTNYRCNAFNTAMAASVFVGLSFWCSGAFGLGVLKESKLKRFSRG